MEDKGLFPKRFKPCAWLVNDYEELVEVEFSSDIKSVRYLEVSSVKGIECSNGIHIAEIKNDSNIKQCDKRYEQGELYFETDRNYKYCRYYLRDLTFYDEYIKLFKLIMKED